MQAVTSLVPRRELRYFLSQSYPDHKEAIEKMSDEELIILALSAILRKVQFI